MDEMTTYNEEDNYYITEVKKVKKEDTILTFGWPIVILDVIVGIGIWLAFHFGKDDIGKLLFIAFGPSLSVLSLFVLPQLFLDFFENFKENRINNRINKIKSYCENSNISFLEISDSISQIVDKIPCLYYPKGHCPDFYNYSYSFRNEMSEKNNDLIYYISDYSCTGTLKEPSRKNTANNTYTHGATVCLIGSPNVKIPQFVLYQKGIISIVWDKLLFIFNFLFKNKKIKINDSRFTNRYYFDENKIEDIDQNKKIIENFFNSKSVIDAFLDFPFWGVISSTCIFEGNKGYLLIVMEGYSNLEDRLKIINYGCNLFKSFYGYKN